METLDVLWYVKLMSLLVLSGNILFLKNKWVAYITVFIMIAASGHIISHYFMISESDFAITDTVTTIIVAWLFLRRVNHYGEAKSI